MDLLITQSMLRGDLRRHILPTLFSDKDISLMWHELSKCPFNNTEELMTVEKCLKRVLEGNGIVILSEAYESQASARRGAEKARSMNLFSSSPAYTPISKTLRLDGLFDARRPNAPIDKFLSLLLVAERSHVMLNLKYFARSVRDDKLVRAEVKKLLAHITSLCKDTSDEQILESLTQLYFEVYHTFRVVLESGDAQGYETDFENFVYEWSGSFPDDEIMARYESMTKEWRQKPKENTEGVAPSVQETNHQTPVRPKTKIELFLEEAAKLGFYDVPKVRELGREKVLALVECLLETKESEMDTYGHTAAMLEFLGFYDHIKDTMIPGYKQSNFDKWCTKVIMNGNGDAFRHYRMSVNANPDSASDTLRYKGWKYKKSVIDEYNALLGRK